MSGKAIETGATDAFVCVVSGTVGGLVIGLITEYYTSFSYAPVREVSGKETRPLGCFFYVLFFFFTLKSLPGYFSWLVL